MNKKVSEKEDALRLLGSIINIPIYAVAFSSVINSIYNTSSIIAFVFFSIMLFLIIMVLLFSIKEILIHFNINNKKLISFLQTANNYIALFIIMVLMFAAASEFFEVGTYENLLTFTIIYIIYLVVSNIVFEILKKKYKIK